jgi:chemotaxis protein MotB
MSSGKALELKKPAEEGAPAWMCTFADLMSLLLCFFVLMLSFSEMDRKMFKVLSGSLRDAFGVQRDERVWDFPKGMNIFSSDFKNPKFLSDELEKELRSAMRLAKGGSMAEVSQGEWSVRITLPGNALFDLGSTVIKADALPVLDELREVIRKSSNRVLVSGHTDDLPIRTAQFPSNWELSAARAGSVIRHLLTQGDIDPTRFMAVGMADTQPRAPNDSEENRALNRRVEIAFQKPLEDLSTRIPAHQDTWIFDPIF